MLTEQAIQRVRQFRQTKGWTLSKFAREAELRESTIRKMDEPDWNPEHRTLAKLEAVVIAQEQISEPQP
jgi:ribosome-binding protein aMBF1 (putative translation factor)